jgi:A/G-specific adenine glycosylase
MIPQKRLLSWYQVHKRDLPWRNTQDPYIIWLSEIILQQTRVVQGMPYFLKFAQTYPRVHDLAQANQEEILKLWQGLGYYSRARNMHLTANIVAQQHNGQFPKSYSELIQLKGIGTYTAAAIASFAYNEPVAVLDGNVFRVLSRLYAQAEPINSGTGKRIFTELAEQFLNKKFPGEHNQALMELGSLVCTPQNPLCFDCPLSNNCQAFLTGTQSRFPVKIQKRRPTTRYFNFFIVKRKNEIAFLKRNGKDIWHNLFQLPLIETFDIIDFSTPKNLLKSAPWFKPKNLPRLVYETKHLLTHQHIEAKFFEIDLNKTDMDLIKAEWIPIETYKKLPIPRLIEKFFEFYF